LKSNRLTFRHARTKFQIDKRSALASRQKYVSWLRSRCRFLAGSSRQLDYLGHSNVWPVGLHKVARLRHDRDAERGRPGLYTIDVDHRQFREIEDVTLPEPP